MNNKLLLEVADEIEKEPDHFNQNSWGIESLNGFILTKIPEDCGSACCVLGWGLALSPSNLHEGYPLDLDYVKHLGFTGFYLRQADSDSLVYSPSEWTDEESDMFLREGTKLFDVDSELSRWLFRHVWPDVWLCSAHEDAPLMVPSASIDDEDVWTTTPEPPGAIEVLRRLANNSYQVLEESEWKEIESEYNIS